MGRWQAQKVIRDRLVGLAAKTTPGMVGAAPRCFKEDIGWRQRLRGEGDLDDKAKADLLAIGGLRNAADAVSRLHLPLIPISEPPSPS